MARVDRRAAWLRGEHAEARTTTARSVSLRAPPFASLKWPSLPSISRPPSLSLEYPGSNARYVKSRYFIITVTHHIATLTFSIPAFFLSQVAGVAQEPRRDADAPPKDPPPPDPIESNSILTVPRSLHRRWLSTTQDQRAAHRESPRARRRSAGRSHRTALRARTPHCAALEISTAPTRITPPSVAALPAPDLTHDGRQRTTATKKILRAQKDTTPKTPINGACRHWGRPGNGAAALFLRCERGSHRHTAVITRPRLRLGWLPQPRRIPSIQPSAANQGAGFGEWRKKYTRQTPTKNDFFQGTEPVFGISTREIPVNTKEILRLFR